MTEMKTKNSDEPGIQSRSERILNYLRAIDIIWLEIIPIFAAFTILLGLSLLARYLINDDELFDVAQIFIVGLVTFIAGMGGVAQIWRREAYGPLRPFRGVIPVISGSIFTILCWSASAYLFYLSLAALISK